MTTEQQAAYIAAYATLQGLSDGVMLAISQARQTLRDAEALALSGSPAAWLTVRCDQFQVITLARAFTAVQVSPENSPQDFLVSAFFVSVPCDEVPRFLDKLAKGVRGNFADTERTLSLGFALAGAYRAGRDGNARDVQPYAAADAITTHITGIVDSLLLEGLRYE